MASIILSAAGSSLGGGSFFGMALGGALGRSLGGVVDNALFGNSIHREGARLEELSVQTSTYGKMIPLVYGTARIAGNILWARPIKEVAETTETSTGGKGGGGASASQTNYSYYTSLAIAICEGEINEVLRIWADSKLLDLSQGTYRIYKGSETQTPDSFIESFEGVGKTPAYRGMAYIVVEDFPLAPFGTIGATLGNTAHQDFTYTGNFLRPYSPVHLSGTRDASGNLTLNWTRRSRGQADWRDYADVPLLEESEAYEVEILDGAEVVRVIAATSPSAAYSAAEQVTDFGATQASVSVKVYQLSAVVGRGRGGSGVV